MKTIERETTEPDTIQPDTVETTALAIGAFEACGEHLGHDADAPCLRCGWLGHDHVAQLAVVIEVRRPEPMPLRRAG